MSFFQQFKPFCQDSWHIEIAKGVGWLPGQIGLYARLNVRFNHWL